MRKVKQFFKTPKGLVTIILLILTAIAAPGEGVGKVALGMGAAVIQRACACGCAPGACRCHENEKHDETPAQTGYAISQPGDTVDVGWLTRGGDRFRVVPTGNGFEPQSRQSRQFAHRGAAGFKR